MTFEEIKESIAQELLIFQQTFDDTLKTSVSLLNIITKYIVKQKGKQMRPMFVFLSAKIFGETTIHTQRAATLVELLHTATLIHDDVVDDANLRRGFFSINALWKNKASVLIGDFLLSKGMLLALENKEYKLLEIVSQATKQMSEGEILQIEKARQLDITEDVYIDIIRMKTASFIASCCAAGAASVNATEYQIDEMYKFGEYVGLAFQIRDDIIDFETGNNSGKPIGGDIKEKKITLPLIYTLKQLSALERKKYILKIKYNNNSKTISEIIDLIYKHKGIEYANKRMNEYLDLAINILDEVENSTSKTALIELVKYSIKRNK